jgi:FtsP/CotA-like multicopper oxidase with cupredoxin domain
MVISMDLPRRRILGWGLAALGAGAVAVAPGRQARADAGDAPTTRTYYIAADTVSWNYTPQGRNMATGKPFMPAQQRFTEPGPDRIGSVYEKSLYREYTDASFTELVEHPHDAYRGLLGPIIRAQVGDTIRVFFKNNTPFPASMHPHGVWYDKRNEGALSNDGTSHAGDAVPPGGTYVYTWEVPDRAGPGEQDPSSVAWLYHDHSVDMGIPGTQAGLIGTMVITRQGDGGCPRDVDREIFTLFTQFDENLSPYLPENIKKFAGKQRISSKDTAFQNSNRKQSINGYLYGNGPEGTTDSHPAIVLHRGERVRWYVMGFGGARDTHAPHWHGNTGLVRGHRVDVVTVLPATVVTADMKPDSPGIWLFHCHVDEHMDDGMITRYQVL